LCSQRETLDELWKSCEIDKTCLSFHSIKKMNMIDAIH